MFSAVLLAAALAATPTPVFLTGQGRSTQPVNASLSPDGGYALDVNVVSTVAGGGSGGGLTDTQLRATPVPTTDTHTTAAVPLSVRLSDGSAFYNASGGGGGGTSSTYGAAFPTTGTAAGAKVLSGTPTYSNGNMEAPTLTTAGRLTVDGSGVTQPVSGTVTATGPLTDTQLRATPVPVSGTVAATQSGTWTVQPGNTANTTAWKVDGSAVTQPVSGTVTANQGGTWTLAANQSTNVAQFGGSAVVTGVGASGAGVPRVTVATDSALVLAANSSVNLAQVAGSTASTAATGVLKVGLVGNAGAIFDAANNSTAPANIIVDGAETATQGTTQPTAATAGNVRRLVASTDGSLYVRPHGPVTWTCSVDGIGATLTQCQAAPAAGLKLYLTDVVLISTTATAGLFLIRYGTGTNCGTGTVSLLPSAATVPRLPYPGNTSILGAGSLNFGVPLGAVAANAICVICAVTNTCTVQLSGYTAP